MSSDPQQLHKLEAVKRSLAIANRVTSAAIVEARKGRKKKCASSVSGGKRKRSASPGGKRKKSPAKRKKSPAKRK